MKIKMLEYFQGREIQGILEPGKGYDVDGQLAAFLLENRKAVKPDAVQPAPVVVESVTNVEQTVPTDEPIMNTETNSVRKSKRQR